MSFEVTFDDATRRTVDGADAYEQDGPLTTFYVTDGRPARLGSAFATRVASFRTDRVIEIRRTVA